MAKIRGVNIGNWLVLEKWMKPELFSGLAAEDETDFCKELGEKAAERLKVHRDTYITYEDFKWIADSGMNSVRIPVPYWIFGDVQPYVGSIEYLDSAMEWAEKTGLKVLIDLHTVPGSQNGFDNGGLINVCTWHTKPDNIDRSVEVLEKLAARYKNSRALWGMQLLNEPRWDVPMDILQDFYKRGYAACRKHLDTNIAIVFHDGFRLKEWKDFMQEPEYKNVILDTHFYHCFAEEDTRLSMGEILNKVMTVRTAEIKEMSQYFKIIIGEWSLGIHPEFTFKNIGATGVDAGTRAYGGAQIYAYENAEGWFFWSYKLMNDGMLTWDYRKCTEKGWLSTAL